MTDMLRLFGMASQPAAVLKELHLAPIDMIAATLTLRIHVPRSRIGDG